MSLKKMKLLLEIALRPNKKMIQIYIELKLRKILI
jgi:hypothetical protein